MVHIGLLKTMNYLMIGKIMTNNLITSNRHNKSPIMVSYEKGIRDGQIIATKQILEILDEAELEDIYVHDSILIKIRDKLRGLYGSE